MQIEFTNPRIPTSAQQLTEIQKKQLEVAGTLYDSADLSAEERLSQERGQEDIDEGISFYGFIELWDVRVDGVHQYDAYMVMADSGVVFDKDKTTYVTERIQAYFGGGGGSREGEKDFLDALQSAYAQARKKYAAQLKSGAASGPWAAYQKALNAAQTSAPKKKAPAKKATRKAPAKKTKKASAKTKAKKTTKKSAKKATKKATKKVAKKATRKATKKTTKKTTKKATKKASAKKKPAVKKKPAKKK